MTRLLIHVVTLSNVERNNIQSCRVRCSLLFVVRIYVRVLYRIVQFFYNANYQNGHLTCNLNAAPPSHLDLDWTRMELAIGVQVSFILVPKPSGNE